MSGWEPATAVFLVGLAVTFGAVLVGHYAREIARVLSSRRCQCLVCRSRRAGWSR